MAKGLQMKIVLIGTVASSVVGFRSMLIKTLVNQGHTVFALAVDYTDELKSQVEDMGAIPVDYRFNRFGLNPYTDLKYTFKLARIIRKLNPDVVFSYFAKPVVFGTIAAYLAKVPRRIAMLEGLGFAFTEHPGGVSFKARVIRLFQVFLYKISFRFLDRIIFLNKDDPADLLEKYKIDAKVVSILGGIGVDLEQYEPREAKYDPVRFIFVGRLLAEKGVNEFVDAARIVKKKHPDVEFVMLGGLDEGNPGALTMNYMEELVESGTVIYPGQVINVNDWLASASVFVLPSYREGIPRSTQEAMALGRAVITTDVPGCRETVEDGVNGFLVPPWSAEALADKMYCFIEDLTLAQRMGQASLRMAREKFDGDVVSRRLASMITG